MNQLLWPKECNALAGAKHGAAVLQMLSRQHQELFRGRGM